MKAGRELDALVAEKIMCCLVKNGRCGCPGFYNHFLPKIEYWPHEGWDGSFRLPERLAPYSTDIVAALQVIEKITSEKWVGFTIDFRPKRADHGHAWEREAKFIVKTSYGGQGVTPGIEIISSSLPEAICLAALEVTQEK